MPKQKIAPFLWFDTQAHEAAKSYVSLFKNGSKITSVTRYAQGGPMPAGSVMTVAFTICGQSVTALNAGPVYKLSPAFSFVVSCDTQKEVDTYWSKLLAGGGQPSQCGWLTDRFGLSWQIVPTILPKLLGQKDRKKANRAMAAMMQMVKLDIQALKDASAGKG